MELAEVKELLKTHYAINATPKSLDGEVDLNFYINENGEEYTLKISSENFDIEEVDFQQSFVLYLINKGFPYQLPLIQSSSTNSLFESFTDQENRKRVIRLQQWIPGSLLNDTRPINSSLLYEWGTVAGHLSAKSQGFEHSFSLRKLSWDPSNILDLKYESKVLTQTNRQELVAFFFDLFENETKTILNSCRKGINHNDLHDMNILISTQNQFNENESSKISGVIDFGDAVYTHKINELAISCAYGCMSKEDPLESACHIVQGYHSIFPIEENELKVLYSMISCRLMITVIIAAINAQREPENEYLQVSAEPAWKLLRKWRNINKDLAHYSFRAACDLTPCPKEDTFNHFIKNNGIEFHSVIAELQDEFCFLDLSIGSQELGNNLNFSTPTNFSKHIRRILEDKNKSFGIGGYLEYRPIYTSASFRSIRNEGMDWRTCHLGLDIWTHAGTEIFAPLDGEIFSASYNESVGDYGGLIILKHTTPNLEFFTLYGHLSKDSIEQFESGKSISKGQKIAELGRYQENGHWPPHLHMQIILNMLGEENDFNGVCFPDQKTVYKSLCPDPKLLIPALSPFASHQEKSNQNDFEITRKEIIEKRQKHLGANLSLSYNSPLHIVRGYKQFLYNSTGRRYLDTVNNVAHVGHQHPRIVEAISKQAALLNTNTRYLHSQITEYADALVSTLPESLQVVYLVNSGSEANELALRMAKTHTGGTDMIALETGYHGNTGNTIDISSYKFDSKGGNGKPDHSHIISKPDVFRGKYKDPNTAGKLYAQEIHEKIELLESKGIKCAGFICESVLSCAGQIELPYGFLKESYNYVREHGGVCIADEVQVGFGRTGSHFWAFECQDVIPEIVTLGKPIGNGHPLAAVITTREIASSFNNGMEYFNTFGGNPVSAAVGHEVLQIIKNEELQHNALYVGQYFKNQLKDLQSLFPIIGDVRGMGLFLGFELIEDPESLKPATSKSYYLSNRMKEHGILTSVDGPLHNVIKIKPPLCITKKNIDYYIERLSILLNESFMQIKKGKK